MKCEDLLKAINEYVDGNIDPAVCDEFRGHLEKCNPCQVVVDNVRHTIKLFQAGKPFDLPPSFQEKLHRNLQDRWKAKFPPQRT